TREEWLGRSRLPSRRVVSFHRENPDVLPRPASDFAERQKPPRRVPRQGPLAGLGFDQTLRLIAAVAALPVDAVDAVASGSECDALSVRSPNGIAVEQGMGRQAGQDTPPPFVDPDVALLGID